MPPKPTKISVVRQYMNQLDSVGASVAHYSCNICHSVLSGSKQWNLVSHFEKQHPEIFQADINKRLKEADLPHWEISRLEQIHCLAELVTINNRPFSIFRDTGLVKLRQREVESLQKAGYAEGITGNCPAVMEHINDWACEIINRIKQEVKYMLISLMADIGSKNGRDILGISIQYARNGEVVIRSVGMIELKSSHTAEHIKGEILKCLKSIGVTPNQVVSITCDNASNMLAMVKLFNVETDTYDEMAETECPDEELEHTPSNANSDIYDDNVIRAEIANILQEFNNIDQLQDDDSCEAAEDEAEISELLDDTTHYFELLHWLHNEFIMHTMNSNGIKCAAHTVQLAVWGALKTKNIQVIIAMCRVACKLLRKSAYKNKLLAKNLKISLPRLDCATRWNSTYTMVRLINLFAIQQNSVKPWLLYRGRAALVSSRTTLTFTMLILALRI